MQMAAPSEESRSARLEGTDLRVAPGEVGRGGVGCVLLLDGFDEELLVAGGVRDCGGVPDAQSMRSAPRWNLVTISGSGMSDVPASCLPG